MASMLRRFVLAAAATAALAAAVPSAASAQAKGKTEIVEEMSLKDLEKLLKGMGFEVSEAADGKALLFKLNDYNILLFSNGTNAQFLAYFDHKELKKKKNASVEHMNRWNREKRFSRAYLDKDGDPTIEWDVDFEGGVTTESVRVAVRTFRDVTTHFAGFLTE